MASTRVHLFYDVTLFFFLICADSSRFSSTATATNWTSSKSNFWFQSKTYANGIRHVRVCIWVCLIQCKSEARVQVPKAMCVFVVKCVSVQIGYRIFTWKLYAYKSEREREREENNRHRVGRQKENHTKDITHTHVCVNQRKPKCK